MKIQYLPLHIVATCIGALCIGTDLLSNVDFMVEQTRTLYDSSVLAVIVVGIAGTVALSVALMAWRNWAIVTGLMVFVGYLAATAFSLTATLDRVASVRDAKLERIWHADPEIQRLVKVRNQMDYLATRERTEGKRDPKGRIIRVAGTGDSYNAAKSEAQIANDLIVRRKADLDALGKRISAMTAGFVSVEQASMYQPVLLPFALLLLGQWLCAFGIAGQKVKPEFNTGLTGRSATEDKVRRFVRQFEADNGRAPKAAEIARAIGVTATQARRLAR